MIASSSIPWLLEPRRPWRAILVGWPTATLPSLVLATLVAWLLPHTAGPELPVGGLVPFLLVVAFSPLVETLIMALVIELGLLVLPPLAVVLLSAAGWGVAHSLAAPAWGLVIWWPFLIFSTLYITWRGEGRARAIAIVVAVHALNNLGPALLLLRSA